MTLPIRVLGTGGTIACTHDASGHLVPTLSTAELLAQAGFHQEVGKGLVAADVMSIDSSSITLEQIDELLDHIDEARKCASAVIVLHGTDTMEETLMAASLAFGSGIPIVFTGAQRPADDAEPDGLDNIAGAIALARQDSIRSRGGVWLSFGGTTLPARGVYKAHTTARHAFHNAQDGKQAGKQAGKVNRDELNGQRGRLASLMVPIIATCAGDNGAMMRHAVSQPIDGLVIEALGSGNVPGPVADALEDLATKRPEVPVIITTRVPEGGVAAVYGGSGGGASLAAMGGGSWSTGGMLRPSQARMALLHQLALQRQARQV